MRSQKLQDLSSKTRSHLAAEQVAQREGPTYTTIRRGSHRHRLLLTYRAALTVSIFGGLTDAEAVAATALPPRACGWRRCGELREGGFIAVNGVVVSETGAEARTCRITAAGLAELERLG